MNSKMTNNSKFTEDWVPIKNITNGFIELDNKHKVTGVKIKPRNIFILDVISQDNVISSLKTFYDTLDFEFWLISTDRPVDISSYLATLQLQYNQAQDSRIKKLLIQDIDKANDFIKDNVTDIEYFLLFKDKNVDILQKRLRSVILGLNNCGLECAQTSNADLRMIVENFLNGGMSTTSKVVLPDEF